MTNAKQTIYDLRRNNLRLLIEDCHGSKNLAVRLGLSNPSFLSHLAGPNPQRVVTEKTARRFELALNLEDGWMDKGNVKFPIYKSSSKLRDITPLELPSPKNNTDDQAGVEQAVTPQNLAIDTARLSECLEKVLSKGRNLNPKQLSKIATVLYSSSHNGDQLDVMTDTLIDLMGA